MRDEIAPLWRRRINDCGPLCLELVARYHDVPVDIARIRRLTNRRWWGTTLLDLARAAERLGFTILTARIELEVLPRVPLPCIAHVRGNHFVVVRHADAERVGLVDPSTGCLEKCVERFRTEWRGIVLLLWPASSPRRAVVFGPGSPAAEARGAFPWGPPEGPFDPVFLRSRA